MSISEMKLIHDRLTALEHTIAVQAAMIDELIGMSGGVAAARTLSDGRPVTLVEGPKKLQPSLRSAG